MNILLLHGTMSLVSVSCFASDYGLELNSYFLREKGIDFDIVRRHTKQNVVIYGDDDPYVTQDALRELAEELHVDPAIINNGGHLNEAAGYKEFPLLLEKTLEVINS